VNTVILPAEDADCGCGDGKPDGEDGHKLLCHVEMRMLCATLGRQCAR